MWVDLPIIFLHYPGLFICSIKFGEMVSNFQNSMTLWKEKKICSWLEENNSLGWTRVWDCFHESEDLQLPYTSYINSKKKKKKAGGKERKEKKPKRLCFLLVLVRVDMCLWCYVGKRADDLSSNGRYTSFHFVLQDSLSEWKVFVLL